MGLIFLLLIRIWVWNQYPDNHLIHLNDNGEVYEFVGRICFEPDYRRDDIRYVVCPEDFPGRFLLKTSVYEKFGYGDSLRLRGVFTEPFEMDEFSYKNYLRIFNVSSIFELRGTVKRVKGGSGVMNRLFRFKIGLLEFYESKLNEPASSLVAGLLLGSRKGFSDEVMDQFNRTGLTHIIAVSGYNISIIILILTSLLKFVPRQIRFWIIGLFLLAFMAITSFTASVIRAVAMGIISLAALEVGEDYNFARALFIVAFGMAMWNPAFLFYDAGFHLSFLATLGVVYLAKYLDFKFVPDAFGLREAFVLTIAAQIATLPILIISFGRVSVISPVANLLVAPFVPIVMLCGVLILIPFLAWPISLLINTVTLIIFAVVNVLSNFSYSSISF